MTLVFGGFFELMSICRSAARRGGSERACASNPRGLRCARFRRPVRGSVLWSIDEANVDR